MPPAPRSSTTSYGPSRVPGESCTTPRVSRPGGIGPALPAARSDAGGSVPAAQRRAAGFLSEIGRGGPGGDGALLLPAPRATAHRQALRQREVVHVQPAVQVVHLVLGGGGEEALAAELLHLPVDVEELDGHDRRALHLLGLAGDGETSLAVDRR